MRGKLENLDGRPRVGDAIGRIAPPRAREAATRISRFPSRVGGAPLPSIFSRRFEKSNRSKRRFVLRTSSSVSRSNVREGHQSILFLNKRGHSRFIQCNACGWTARCKNCDIALIYHRVANRLKCHYCGYNKGAVSKCEKCGGTKLFFSGAGTQRVELDLAALLPGVGILRMDADTTAGKEGHRRVLEQFSTGKYPILIGTQMVSKGHHFPNVNLVGVLYAEESLNYPDFRSAERTFQQLVQVAGRAGAAGGDAEVVVQTFTPDHYVFKFLREHDYSGFMTEELAVRRELRYPPFSRIVLASFSAVRKDVLHATVTRWTERDPANVRPMGRRDSRSGGSARRTREEPISRARAHQRGRSPPPSRTNSSPPTAGSSRAAAGGGGSIELRWDVDPESFG